MRARLVRPDGTTEAISLPAGTGALTAMYELIGCDAVKAVRVIRPGAASGVTMWCDEHGLIRSRPVINPAARAIVAFLSRRRVIQDFAGPVIFTGGPGGQGGLTPLTSDYDEIITTIAGQLRSRAAGQHGDQPAGGERR
jgi:hypothetical protein